jgi:hypothetical protein
MREYRKRAKKHGKDHVLRTEALRNEAVVLFGPNVSAEQAIRLLRPTKSGSAACSLGKINSVKRRSNEKFFRFEPRRLGRRDAFKQVPQRKIAQNPNL